ncbi:MAG: sulfatase-like hydrolase/transferase [Saprospiraceae bacterium]|nr:sulfatase-like hydrolase/transferase [Saprospiraceae bacterium]
MLHKNNLYYVSLLVKRLAIVYLLFAICRLLFYTYNATFFNEISALELGALFILALRFDTSSILYVNVLVVFMHIIPFSLRTTRWYQKLLKLVFLISNALVLFIELADIVYYPYAFRRMLRSDFDMSGDIQNLIPQFISEFWALMIIYIFLIGLTYYLYKKTEKDSIGPLAFTPQIILFIFFSAMTVLGMRGGFQLRPIMPVVASQYVSNIQYMPLVSNTTLGLIHSFFQREVKQKSYFNLKTLERIYSLDKKATHTNFDKKNIVILVCESLGNEYVGFFGKGKGNTPFLDSMLQEGVNFVNMYANGTRSTQGLAAINGSLPALMTDPFIFSAYQNNNIIGLGDLLIKEGYTNAFFHGGEVGTMGFDHFMPTVGIHNYFGRHHYLKENNYSKNQDYDGNWGVWDVPFYDYAIKKIGTFQQPFFTTLLSINVHHPFNVEPWFVEQYPKRNKRQRAIKYADHNLKLFFEKASKYPWFDSTLFVITADHTGPNRSAQYMTREGCYRIPLLLYCPSDSSLIGVREEVTQQIDIMPTVLGYLGYSKAYKSFGVNKFDNSNTEHYSYTFEKDIYQIIANDFVLQFDGEKTIALYNKKNDINLRKNIASKHPDVIAKLERHLKAVIQTYNRVLIENKY